MCRYRYVTYWQIDYIMCRYRYFTYWQTDYIMCRYRYVTYWQIDYIMCRYRYFTYWPVIYELSVNVLFISSRYKTQNQMSFAVSPNELHLCL
jgi:hypothetical protein